MKWLTTVLFFILMAAACNNHGNPIDSLHPWPASGNEDADSAILKYVSLRAQIPKAPESTRDSLLDLMDSIADATGNKLIRFRAKLMHISHILDEITADSAKSLIYDAYSDIDSASYPYDWHMLKSMETELEDNYVKRYTMIMGCLNFFQKYGADVEVGRHAILAGNLMNNLQDTVSALDFYRQADEIYTRLDIRPFMNIARLNIAIVSPKPIKDSINYWLRTDTDALKDPHLQVLVNQNSFVSTDSIHLLDRALHYSMDYDVNKKKRPILLALKGGWLLDRGDPVEALSLIDSALIMVDEETYEMKYVEHMHYLRALAFNRIALLYNSVAAADSTVMELNNVINLKTKKDKVYNRAGVYSEVTKAALKLADENAALQRRHTHILWTLVSSIIIIVGSFLFYILKRRSRERELKQKLMEDKLAHTKKSMMAQNIVIQENDRLISEISHQIKIKTGDIPPDSETEALSRMLKLYKGNEENRQGFLKAQKEINADFEIRLKETYPDLTEGQIRLASLIASGADMATVCRILNVEQSSVHKSRYRLRGKLHLERKDSLEDFLRRFNQSS